jgi:hypothetical protein
VPLSRHSQFPIHPSMCLSHVIIRFLTLPPTPLSAFLTPQASSWPCHLYYHASISYYSLFLDPAIYTSARPSHTISCSSTLLFTPLNASLTSQASFWSCYLHFYMSILCYNLFLDLIIYTSKRLFHVISQFLTLLSTPPRVSSIL